MRILLDSGKDEEIRLAGCRIPDAVARRERDLEAARPSTALVEVLKDREYHFDRVPNAVIVRDHFLPIYPRFRQGRPSHAGNDRRLGEEVRACRPVATGRCLHHTGRILDRDHLRPLGLLIELGAAEAWHDERLAPVYEMAAIGLGVDSDRQAR